MIVNKKNEIEVLKEVQKNTEMAMKAIETITPKVYDDGLALQLSRQALKYSAIHNKAVDGILEDRAMPYPANAVKDAMLTGGIHMNTMFDTSSSHIAELVIATLVVIGLALAAVAIKKASQYMRDNR